jgi:2-dehydro-3-deoxyglucarate aldolase/4-hydroxy-2-oxoheptanedioate aldolase
LQPNAIKNDVMAGTMVAGAMVFEFFSPGTTAIMANAGCRFVFYDMEHTGLGFETLKWLFASGRGLPIEPMVRVPRGEYAWLARALDMGARGVMIPMVESAGQARSIVESCRYPPIGRRGAAFGFAQDDYLGGDVGQKIRAAHERTLIVAQIETERGLDNVEAIAAVEGIDVLWVGHFDLSNFLGIPGGFADPRFDAAMRRVASVAHAYGKAAGFMATDEAWIERVREMGYTMLAIGTDVGLLGTAVGRLVARVAAGTATPGTGTTTTRIGTAPAETGIGPARAGAARTAR